MNRLLLLGILCVFCATSSTESTDNTTKKIEPSQDQSMGNDTIEALQAYYDKLRKEAQLEDELTVNETIAKYGPLYDYKNLGLPGPEYYKDLKKYMLQDQFIGDSKNYTLRIRTILETISFNARYEEGFLNTTEERPVPVIPVVKGQVGEYFIRKSGGYYIRTIGYTLDENGYRHFLIDLSTAKMNLRHRIPSTALASLIGGNPLG